MKLDPNIKRKLLESISKVQDHYSALELLNANILNRGTANFVSFVTSKLNEIPAGTEHSYTTTVDGIECEVKVKKDSSNNISFTIRQTNQAIPAADYQRIHKYKTSQEKLNCLCQHTFTLTKNNNNEYLAGTTIQIDSKSYNIGGGDKLPLYKSHLDSLSNIYDHINTDADIKNILIALATGSGKTFIQALWFLVLEVAGMDGIFALPKNLVKQFEADLRKLLPDELVNEVYMLDPELADKPPHTKEQDEEVIKALGNSTILQRKRFIISSYEKLLDKNYTNLSEVNHNIFLSFDEQHRITQNESRKLKLEALARKYLFVSLTATPDKTTYDYSGGKPVATMSNKKKAEQNQGNLPSFITLEAKTINDKLDLLDNAELKTANNKMKLLFADTIQQQLSSPAITLVEELPYMTYTDSNGQLLKPAGNKLLVIVDDLNEMINLNNAIRNEENYIENEKAHLEKQFDLVAVPYKKHSPIGVYSDGNKKDRDRVYEFFNLTDHQQIDNPRGPSKVELHNIERDIQQEYQKTIEDKFKRITGAETALSTREHLERNIYQGLMEYYLRFITNLSTIQLNEYRKNNIDGLVQLVRNTISLNEYQSHAELQALFKTNLISNGIDDAGANDIAFLLSRLHDKMKEPIDRTRYKNFVLNDSLKTHVQELIHEIGDQEFKRFANKHLMLFMVDGLAGTEKPFTHFAESKRKMYTPEGTLAKDAKKRKPDITETLDENSYEYFYEPVNVSYDEKTADAYFKQGFIGMYVSNKKTEGFNDPNLATTIQIIPDKENSLNNPAKAIQAAGRCRGLDPSKPPIVIQVIGKGTQPTFNLNENLNKDDYFPEYFQALEKYKKIHFTAMSKQIKNEVLEWIRTHSTEKRKINKLVDDHYETSEVTVNVNIKKNDLNKAIQFFVTKAIREINNDNNHALDQTRRQIKKLINLVHDELRNEIESLERPYSISTFAKGTGNVYFGIVKTKLAVLDFFKQQRLNIEYLRSKVNTWFTPSASEQPYNESNVHATYIKILKNTSLEGMSENSVYMGNFTAVLQNERSKIKARMEVEGTKFLSDNAQKQINHIAKRMLLPALAKWGVEDIEDKIVTAGNHFNKWHMLLTEYEMELDQLSKSIENAADGKPNQTSPQERKAIALRILKRIPELSQLTEHDIKDIPSIISQSDTLKRTFEHELKQSIKRYSDSEAFLHTIRMVIPEDAYPKVKAIFEQESNRSEWATILTGILINQDSSSKDEILEKFLVFVKSKDHSLRTMETIQERLQQGDRLFAPLTTLLSAIQANPIDHINAPTQKVFNDIVHYDLSDSLIKFYKPEAQEIILNAIRRYTKWPQFLVENKNIFEDLSNAKDNDASLLIIRSLLHVMTKRLESEGYLNKNFAQSNERDLTTAANAAAVTIQKVVNERVTNKKVLVQGIAGAAVSTVQNQVGTVTGAVTGAVLGAASKVFGFLSPKPAAEPLKPPAEQLKPPAPPKVEFIQETTANVLAAAFSEDAFLNALEPMFTNPNHHVIKEKLRVTANAKLFAATLISKYNIRNAEDLDSKSPEEVLTIFVETFNTCFRTNPPLKSFPESLAEGFTVLEKQVTSMEQATSSAKLRYLKEEDVAFINSEMKMKFLPLMVKWLSPEIIDRINDIGNRYDKWPKLLIDLEAKFIEIQDLSAQYDIEFLLQQKDEASNNKLLAIENHIQNFAYSVFNYILKDTTGHDLKMDEKFLVNYLQIIKNVEVQTQKSIKEGIHKNPIIDNVNRYLSDIGMHSFYYKFDGDKIKKVDPIPINDNPNQTIKYERMREQLQAIPAVKAKETKDITIDYIKTLVPFYVPGAHINQFVKALDATYDWHWLLLSINSELSASPSLLPRQANRIIFDRLINIFRERHLLNHHFPKNAVDISNKCVEAECKFLPKYQQCLTSKPWYNRYLNINYDKTEYFKTQFKTYISSPDFLKFLPFYLTPKMSNALRDILKDKIRLNAMVNALTRIDPNPFNKDLLLDDLFNLMTNYAAQNDAVLRDELDKFNEHNNLSDLIKNFYNNSGRSLIRSNGQLSESEIFQEQVQKNLPIVAPSGNENKFAQVITNYVLETEDSDLTLPKLKELYKMSVHGNQAQDSMILSIAEMAEIGSQQIAQIVEEHKEHVDKQKLNTLFKNSIMPSLSHPTYAKTVKYVMGYLSKDDLITILSAINKAKNVNVPQAELARNVDDLTNFMKLLNEGKYSEIYGRFFDLNHVIFINNQSIEESLESIKGLKLLTVLSDIFKEVYDCQRHFYQLKNDSSHVQERPALVSAAKPNISNIVSNASKEDAQALSLQGTTNALDTSNTIQVLSQRNLINTLNYADKQIKQIGVEISSSTSKTVSMITGQEDVYLAKTYLNTLKRLKPLTREDIAKATCPEDAVETLLTSSQADPNIQVLEAYEKKVIQEIIDFNKKNEPFHFIHPDGSFDIKHVDGKTYSVPFTVAHAPGSNRSNQCKYQAQYYNALVDLLSVITNDSLVPEKRLKLFRKQLHTCNIIYSAYILKNHKSTLFTKGMVARPNTRPMYSSKLKT